MEDFLLRLLQMSAAGSVLAGLILLWRRFLRKEAIHAVFYYMWLLVLLRLCVPFGVTLPLPVMGEPILEGNQTSQAHKQSEQSAGVQSGAAESGADRADSWDIPPSSDALSAPPVADASQNRAGGISDYPGASIWWMLVWTAGAIVSLGRYVAGYVRFARAVRENTSDAPPKAWDILNELEPGRRVGLVECPVVTTPMLIGIARPLIILPTGVKEERMREILIHELVHARRHDLLYKWFAAAVTSLHWFNPMMILVRREIGRACELSCDEAVMRGMDEKERRHYGDTLLYLAAAPVGSGLVAMTLCEEKEQLRERLVTIATYRKKKGAAVLVSLCVAAFLGGCATVSGAKPARGDVAGENASAAVSGAHMLKATPEEELSGTGADLQGDVSDGGRTKHSGWEEGENKTAALLRDALLGKKTFLCMNGDSDPIPIDIGQVAKVFSPDSEYAKIWKFAVIDLDGDGEEEAIVRVIDAAGDMGGCMVLHCADGEVLGFAEGYRAFEALKTDGTYNDSDGGILDGVCKMRFSGSSCTFEWLVSCALSGNGKETGPESGYPELSYFVNGAPATEEEWSAALNGQSEKEDEEWYFYSEEAVNERLDTADFPVDYTPDGAKTEYGAAEAAEHDTESPGARMPEKDLKDMYHFPVRVSDTRVLNVVLETSEPQKDYFLVDRIYVYDGDALIQTIETSELTPSEDYLWEGLFVNRGHREGEPDVRDVTFDKAEDFGLLCAASYPKNLPFTYFFWNEAEGGFVQGLTVFGGAALEVDDEQKCLIEHRNDVNGAYTTRYV